MKYTNRADLLIAAGESIKMQEKAGIKPVYKSAETHNKCDLLTANLDGGNSYYEFPLAVVEGKPVFVGDELYIRGHHVTIDSLINNLLCGKYTGEDGHIYDMRYANVVDSWSWNPPKPKTIKPEISREDAEYILTNSVLVSKAGKNLEEAIRKALESK